MKTIILRPRGILWRAAILSCLVTAVAPGLFALFLIPYQRTLLIDRLQSAAEVAATSIAEVTVSSIVVENYSTVVEHCLKVVSERPAVRYIVVTRRDGFSLIHLEGAWKYDSPDGHWLPQPGTAPGGRFLVSDLAGEEVYHYTQSLHYSGIDWGFTSPCPWTTSVPAPMRSTGARWSWVCSAFCWDSSLPWCLPASSPTRCGL